METAAHDESCSEKGVKPTKLHAEPPLPVEVTVSVEGHDEDIEQEIGGRQRRYERVVTFLQSRKLNDDN